MSNERNLVGVSGGPNVLCAIDDPLRIPFPRAPRLPPYKEQIRAVIGDPYVEA